MSRPKIGYTILTGVNKIIELIKNIVPELPTDDGEYRMELHMNDGEATYMWHEGVQPSQESVNIGVADWLDDHPEATTTVQDRSITKRKLYDSEDVNPSNWFDASSATDGIMYANGTTEASTTKIYTDYISVSEGDKIKIFRGDTFAALYRRNICFFDSTKSVVSGGSDSSGNGSYTVTEGVSYVRVTFDKSALSLSPMIVRDGLTPTRYSAYFEPYVVLTDDFLTVETEGIVTKLKEKTFTTNDMANKYACALPKGYLLRQTVGLSEKWYYKNCVSPLTPTGISAGNEYIERDNEYVNFPNETALDSVNGFYWIVYDNLLNEINVESGSAGYGRARKIVAENLQNCSCLVIGDSTVGSGTMTQKMLDYFTSKSKTLTLIGSLGSGDNKNEGRAGWKATDYLTNKQYDSIVNPFYNPSSETFDFSYYMTNQGYSAPDFVVIQLGINDLYNSNLSAIEPTWNAVKTMIDSILTYNSGIHILLNLPNALTSDQSLVVPFLPVLRNLFIKYNEYAMAESLKLYSTTQVRPTYCHLILDPDTDISDNVHPNSTGYEKMAKEVINQINCWQNNT